MNNLFSWINDTFKFLFISSPEVERVEEIIYMPERYVIRYIPFQTVWRECIYCKTRRNEPEEICPGCGAWSHTLHSGAYKEWNDGTNEYTDVIVIKEKNMYTYLSPDNRDYEKYKGVPIR